MMISGGLIAALGAYVFQVYGGRALGAEAFAPISVLWTAYFILATVLLVPLEQYVTREVSRGRSAIPGDLPAILAVTAVGAVAGAAFVVLTRESLFEGRWVFVLQMALVVLGSGIFFVAKGILAGRRRFAAVGWVLIVESAARLVAAVLLVGWIASSVSLAWAIVVGPLAVLGLAFWRHDTGDRATPPTPPGRFLTSYVGGTTSAQLLLGGAPLAVAALGAPPALVSVVFVTFTLFRAPLTLIFSLQGRILPMLVGMHGSDDASGLRRIGLLVGVGAATLAVIGGAVGWAVGPQVVSTLYGEEFTPGATVAMLAAAGIVVASGAQIAGQVLVARARTGRLALAWMAGLLVAMVVLAVSSGTPDLRVAVAFVVGEAVALGVVLAQVLRSTPLSAV